MRSISKSVMLLLLLFFSLFAHSQTDAIRINQLGYYPSANKFALVVATKASSFEIVNISNNQIEFKGNLSPETFWKDAGDSLKICDFSALTKIGQYKIRIPEFGESHAFEIS